MTSSSPSLWHNRDFMKLWAAQAISALGSTITGTALPMVAILTLAATPAQVGTLAALSMLPVLLIGLPAGVWVDRTRRRPILIAADLGRAVLLLSIPITASFGLLNLLQLFIVAFLVGLLTVFFKVADNTFLPTVVERRALVEANSKFGITDAVAESGGSALAGFLVQWLTGPITILIDAVSYLISALFLGLIRTPEVSPSPDVFDEPDKIKENPVFWRDIMTGLRWVLADPYLRALAGSSGTFSFFGGFIGALYTLYGLRELGLTPAMLGVLFGVGGVSALVGAALTQSISRRFKLGPLLIGAFFLFSLATLLIPLAAGPRYRAIALLFTSQLLGDALLAIYMINALSLRQAITPDHLLGRMNATMDFLVNGIGPVGLLLGGLLGQVLGLRPTLAIGALGILAACLWLFFSPVRRLQQLPNPPR